jgi:hypothetical protein
MLKIERMHGMARGATGQSKIAAKKRWAKVSKDVRIAYARYMRACKGAKHSHETKRAIGHYHFMHLVRWSYMRRLGRKLTPAELAWVRATHAEEIAAHAVGVPWVKKPRVTAPGTWT